MSRVYQATAALLLLIYAAVGTSTYAAAATLLANIDGSHEVSVVLVPAGACLTLRHQQGTFTPRVGDHRGMLGRLVTSLCRISSDGDHHLSAESLSAVTESIRTSAQAPTPSWQSLAAAFFSPRDPFTLTSSCQTSTWNVEGEQGAFNILQLGSMMATVRLLL